jgi:pyruvate kinase
VKTKTKIVCTIGPASCSPERLRALAEAGMDVARVNFSHGSREENGEIIAAVQRLRRELGRNIAVLQDLGGPKIRVGAMPAEGLILADGARLCLCPAEAGRSPAADQVPVGYGALLEDIPPGARVLLDDGLLELEVQRRLPDCLECRVLHGGRLYSHKGVSFPGVVLSLRAPTSKDVEDARFGVEHGVDFLALSFVQSADDLVRLREALPPADERVPALIAKLERGAALQNLESILEASDGVMVARGDLGVETDLAMIPIYQKTIIRQANIRGRPTITATQMLDSMIRNPTPTRAEVTDVANAIYDGSDAVMLSGETAVGAYPVEAVRMMRRIADHVEENLGLDRGWVRPEQETGADPKETAVALSVCQTADRLGARCILAQTISGTTARLIARHRPATPIVAVTPLESTYHQLSLVWGVHGVLLPRFEDDFLQTTQEAEPLLRARGYIAEGDLMVVSAGIPAAQRGGTNVMKLQVVGRP